MNWEEDAIVLSVRKFSERDAIITVITRDRGVYCAMAKGAMNKTQRGVFQIGNLIHARWNARLEEQMGNIYAELITPYAAFAMQDRLLLAGISSACALLSASLMERDAHSRLYDVFVPLLDPLKFGVIDKQKWLRNYAWFEYVLLQEIGFGLDLSECAASGVTDDLVYVSPKSGKAVCAIEGKPYHERMLPLPSFVLQASLGGELDVSSDFSETINAFILTGYFIEYWLFASKDKKTPSERARLLQMVDRLELK